MLPEPASALTRTRTAQLTLDLAGPCAARRLVALLLAQWGVTEEDLLDGATIVVSELVTDALVHCDDRGPVALGVHLDGNALVLSVVDPSPVVPAQRAVDDEDGDGHGPSIVSQIASRWGVEPHPVGKRVYAELQLSPVRCA